MTIPHYVPISHVNQVIKELIEYSGLLDDLWVKGEVFNVKRGLKQLFFSIKDEQSQLHCVVFDLFRMSFTPQDGDQVYIRGSVRTFHKKGTLSFHVTQMMASGEGSLHAQFQKLKQTLLKEGVFSRRSQEEIPEILSKIFLVTSPDSAAMWDFVRQIELFAPHYPLVLVPAVMQGAESVLSLHAALDLIDSQKKGESDVVVITRGGGSQDDLSGFNDEGLVRRLSGYALPVVTAIGHDIDETLSDLAACLSYPTPTAAAQGLCQGFCLYKTSLLSKLGYYPTLAQHQLKQLYERVDTLVLELKKGMQSQLDQRIEQANVLVSRLMTANPLRRLQQGFSVSKVEDLVLRSVSQVKESDILETQVQDGKIYSTVLTIRKHHDQ